MDWIGLRFITHIPFPLLDSKDQMDETKFIEKIGPFGILALFFAFFLSFTLCACLIVHVRFIYTYLCPLKSVRDCCRSISRKFRASHKQVPQTIHELEELVSGTKRAKKIARKVNQADSLKEFAQITPRLNNFVIELRQERIFRGGYSVGLQNPEISTIPHARSVRVKPDLHTPFSGQDSKVVIGPKKVSSNPVPKRSSEKIVYGPPELFVGDRQSENHRSLIAPAELVFESNIEKIDSADFQRLRANSADGQLNYQPFPRIKLTRKISSAYEEY